MDYNHFNYQKLKKYLNFLTLKVMSEPFRDKFGQLNKFYIPISKMIEEFIKKQGTKVIGLAGGQGTGKSTISNILKIILKRVMD